MEERGGEVFRKTLLFTQTVTEFVPERERSLLCRVFSEDCIQLDLFTRARKKQKALLCQSPLPSF